MKKFLDKWWGHITCATIMSLFIIAMATDRPAHSKNMLYNSGDPYIVHGYCTNLKAAQDLVEKAIFTRDKAEYTARTGMINGDCLDVRFFNLPPLAVRTDSLMDTLTKGKMVFQIWRLKECRGLNNKHCIWTGRYIYSFIIIKTESA